MNTQRALRAFATLFLCSGIAWAQAERGPGGGRGGQDGNAQGKQERSTREGGQRGGERGGRGGAPDARRLLEYDANGNLLIEEQELRDGLAQLHEDAETALGLVMRGIDANGDGTLSNDEAQGLDQALRTLSTVRRADRNRDWKLDDDEMAALWEQMARACQQYNQDLLQSFDKDGDGKLNGQETAETQQRMPERGRGGGGGERGERDGEQMGGEGRREDRRTDERR